MFNLAAEGKKEGGGGGGGGVESELCDYRQIYEN